jgi:hypothetical protein
VDRFSAIGLSPVLAHERILPGVNFEARRVPGEPGIHACVRALPEDLPLYVDGYGPGRIVKGDGGGVWIESAVGVGTNLSFAPPRRDESAHAEP